MESTGHSLAKDIITSSSKDRVVNTINVNTHSMFIRGTDEKDTSLQAGMELTCQRYCGETTDTYL